jgi:hypothetical protein
MENNNPTPDMLGAMTKPDEAVGQPVVQNISERLSQAESKPVNNQVNSHEPLQFDISKLSGDQLQALKQALNATPDSATRKKENPVVLLRVINGSVVKDFKNAYLGLVEDPENHRQVERHLIPVLLDGARDYVSMRYSEFMQSDRVKAEVISTRKEDDSVVEGTVMSNETGRPTEMLVRRTKDYFTVKLPDGRQMEIEARMANA